jgi:hypothetical protein
MCFLPRRCTTTPAAPTASSTTHCHTACQQQKVVMIHNCECCCCYAAFELHHKLKSQQQRWLHTESVPPPEQLAAEGDVLCGKQTGLQQKRRMIIVDMHCVYFLQVATRWTLA